MTHEVMINTRFGGFGFSEKAIAMYSERKQYPLSYAAVTSSDIPRDDPVMIQIVKELGPLANESVSQIDIVTIPEQYSRHYTIEDYDGDECICIHYDKYKVDSAKAILCDSSIPTPEEMLARISAVLNADLKPVE